ncbi:MAG: hypothetical protein ACLFQZ_12390 [Spirochaetaceae bacterium]
MRHRLLLVLLILVIATAVAFTQEAETTDGEDPVIYPMTVYLNTVYRHSLGYKIEYNDSELYFQEAYLPGRWFTEAAGKAELVHSIDKTVPYMVVYYVDGEFSHLRLFVPESPYHSAWDQLPNGADLEEEFAIETLALEY